MRSLYWLRHDLRIHDNLALIEFCQRASSGLVVWFPTLSFFRADTLRRHFILASLLETKKALDQLGAQLIIFKKTMPELLPELITRYAIEAVFYSSEPTPEEKRDEDILQKIPHIKIFSFFQNSLIHLHDLSFQLDELPAVFTQFRKKVEENLIVSKPQSIPKKIPPRLQLSEEINEWLVDDELKKLEHHPYLIPGEAAGLLRIQHYIFTEDKLKVYKETRNGMLNWNDSTKLSAWLAVGAITARQIYAAIRRYEHERCKNESTYWLIFELLWRDYFRLIALKSQSRLFNQVTGYVIDDKEAENRLFQQWCHANTGDDFVDANMTELNQTGWMSNRGRQNVASYLAKHLKIDWRLGAAYFEKKLIDYDASSNWGNWAYLAGVGQDPRDRVFNTVSQAQRYDKESRYRRLWLGK